MSVIEATRQRINLHDLSITEKKALLQQSYTTQSYFQTLFNNDHVLFDCQPIAQAFRDNITRILLEKQLITAPLPLEQLHDHLSDDMKAYGFDDGINKISTYFYDTDAAFQAVYHQFIRFIRENWIQEPFWFQATPTIRIHCPNGKNSHHYPRYHTDIGYGHPPEEVNFWLPLTHMLTGHGFRVMPLSASRDLLKQFDYDFPSFIHSAIHDKTFTQACEALAQSADVPFGNALAFDSRCVHSGEPLRQHTRISMDIRILPLSQYEKMTVIYQGSGRRKILFAPGHCYHPHHSDIFLN